MFHAFVSSPLNLGKLLPSTMSLYKEFFRVTSRHHTVVRLQHVPASSIIPDFSSKRTIGREVID